MREQIRQQILVVVLWIVIGMFWNVLDWFKWPMVSIDRIIYLDYVWNGLVLFHRSLFAR